MVRGMGAVLISVATDGGFEAHDAAITVWLRHYGAEVVSVAHVLACDRGDFNARPDEIGKVRAVIEEALRSVG
jgi:hypothetical protein